MHTTTVDGFYIEDVEIVQWEGIGVEPALSTIGNSRVYFNPITGKTRISEDGGAWEDLCKPAVDLSGYIKLDQTTPQIITANDVAITASDEVYYGDVTDSTKIKKDTVQGILDLVPAPDLTPYAKLDGSNQPFTGDVEVRRAVASGVINDVPAGIGGIDTYTKLISHFNGTNGQTTYTAESGQVLTFSGNAQLTTGAYKFGTAALLLDGTDDYVSAPASADWDFGTGAFTIDFWFKRNGDGQSVEEYIASNRTTGNGWYIYIQRNAPGRIILYSEYGGVGKGSGFAWTKDTNWHHIAFVRSGSTNYIFLDGVAQTLAEDTISSSQVGNASNALLVGAMTTADRRSFNGVVDEFRISKGIARWTAGFTTPASEYTTVTGTPSLVLKTNSVQKAKVWADGTASDAIKIDDATGTRVTIEQTTGNVTMVGTAQAVSMIETTPTLVKLDQTTPQTMAGLSDGLLNLTLGVIGTDTTTVGLAASALQSETDPVFSGWLSSTPPLYPGGWYDTEQSYIGLSGFSNDSGFLTYYDSISYADSASYAYSADYANYASTADYVTYEYDPTFSYCPYDGQTYGWNNSAWTVVSGDTTFTQWRDGTAFQPTGPCQFDDDPTTPTKYARYWNTPNSSLAEWWDGTNTFTLGGVSGLSYIAGASDILATLNGTFAHFIDAGTSIPFSHTNTKDSTDSVIEIGRFGRATTGTAADGIGGSIPFYLTNDNGDEEIFAQIDVVGTDVSDGTEEGSYSVKVMDAGSLTEHLKVDSSGITASAVESTGDVSVNAQPRVTTVGFTTSTNNAGASSGGAIAVYNDGVTSGQLASITIEEGLITAYTVVP